MIKATDIVKKEGKEVENVYENIQKANERGEFKIVIPHFVYISPAKKIELIDNGFKVYKGNWHGGTGDGQDLIIEW